MANDSNTIKKPGVTGGITVGDKHFGYDLYFETPVNRAVLTDKDKVHTFYWTDLMDGYRRLALDELKRIGWVDKDAF